MVYGVNESSPMIPKDGTWNTKNLRFIEAKQVLHFGVINIAPQINNDAINTFIGALTRAAQDLGMI